jgi:nitrite reductase/ring-hydroxylating ferredoxin subunit
MENNRNHFAGRSGRKLYTRICKASEISEGELYRFETGEMAFLVTRFGEHYMVTQASCTHEEADLTLGILSGKSVTCPLHRAKFDLESGTVLTGPDGEDPETIRPLKVYPTRIEDGILYADL